LQESKEECEVNIEIKNLTKCFGDVCLFKNLSFEITKNEMSCLFGKSGCGKTTLLNILGGIENYDSGTIIYDGKTITKRRKIEYLSKEFGFIFQNFGLLDNETVYDNFMIIKKVRRKKNEERDFIISTSLKKVGLEGFEKKVVCTLSGGEQQRIAVAKIIAKDCNVIFADEPTASLDAGNKNIIMELLKSLKQQGKTIIIVTHDLDIKNISDKVIFL